MGLTEARLPAWRAPPLPGPMTQRAVRVVMMTADPSYCSFLAFHAVFENVTRSPSKHLVRVAGGPADGQPPARPAGGVQGILRGLGPCGQPHRDQPRTSDLLFSLHAWWASFHIGTFFVMESLAGFRIHVVLWGARSLLCVDGDAMTGVEQVALGGGGRVRAAGALDGAGQTQVSRELVKVASRALTRRTPAWWHLPNPGLSLCTVKSGWHRPSLRPMFRAELQGKTSLRTPVLPPGSFKNAFQAREVDTAPVF